MILKISAFKVNSPSFIILKEGLADLNFEVRSSCINLKICF